MKYLFLLSILLLIAHKGHADCPAGEYWDFFVCKPCPAGTYITGTVGKPCEPCAAGTYAPNQRSLACTSCPRGQYQPYKEKTFCYKCPAGKYSTQVGATSSSVCMKCPRGERQPSSGASSCLFCNEGEFQDVEGQTACKKCPTGTYAARKGSVSCSSCPKGMFQPFSGQDRCLPCKEGEYQPREEATYCLKCDQGQYQPRSGQSFCFDCNPGEFQNLKGQNHCQPCKLGQYQLDFKQTKCNECEEGTAQSREGQFACEVCPEGMYSKQRTEEYSCWKGIFPGLYLGTCTRKVGAITCTKCATGTYQDKVGQSVCKQCKIGFYQDISGKSTCKPCPVGTFSNKKGNKEISDCQVCPIGHHQPLEGQSSCNQCIPGQHQNSEGRSQCKSCKEGEYQDEFGKRFCKPCVNGYFQSIKGQSSCQPCPVGRFSFNKAQRIECGYCAPGKYQDEVGKHRCKRCPAGQFQPDSGQSSCLFCNPGEFQNQLGQTSCKSCPRGTYSFGVGNKKFLDCIKCEQGTFQSNAGQSSCNRCSEGEYQNEEGATSCKSCDIGSYTRVKGSIECEQCLPGTYQDTLNSTSCEPCEPGTYAPNLGSSKCEECKSGGYCTDTSIANGGFIACPAGTYNDETGSSNEDACIECPIGTYSLEVGANSRSVCTKCPPGQYQNETGKQVCIPCEVGSYQNEYGQDHCKECNIGEHINITGSSECNDCPYPLANFEKGSYHCSVCRDGYFLVNGTIDINSLHSKPREFCMECPLNAAGTNCTAGTNLTDIPIMAGYWRASKNTSRIYKCNFESNCKGSSSLSFDRRLMSDSAESEEYCTKNYTGALCEACNNTNQYFDPIDGKCKNCRISTLFIQLGMASVAILFFGSIVWMLKNRLTPFTITASSLSIQAKVKILIGFYQIMSAFTDIYGVTIHNDVKQIFYFATDIFSFEFLSSFPLDCLGTTTVAYVISGIWPYLMCIFFWICLTVFKHARICSESQCIAAIAKGISNVDVSQVIVIIFYFALPIVSKHIFDAKICEAFKVDDFGDGSFESYLVSSRTILCDTKLDSSFRELQICFWIFFLLWPCLTLLGFSALVTKVFTSVHFERPSALAMKCQFLWRDFDPTSNIAIYWDIIDFSRKVFLIGFINFFDQNEGSNKLLRLTIATAVSSVFMLILLYVRPYRRSDDFQLAVVSSFLITLAFALGYILQICENDESACKKYISSGIDDHLGASILVTILVIGMLAITLLALIFQTRYSPIARLKSTRHPPNLNLPEDCTHHVFMSHRWEGGQDKCHSIARKLQLYIPGLKVWLDVDNLSNTSELEDSVHSSVVFLLSFSFGYFERPNCRREFYQALFLDKSIVLVYSDDSFPSKAVEAYESEKNCIGKNIYFELITEECKRFCLPEDEGGENSDFEKEIIQILEKSEVPECDWQRKVAKMTEKVKMFIVTHLNDKTSENLEANSSLLQVEDNSNAVVDATSEQLEGNSSLSHVEENANAESDTLAIQWLKTGSFSSESLKLIYFRILSSLPHYSSGSSALLLKKGLRMPNDEKTPKLKFQVEVLFSSQNQGVELIADELKSLNSQSVTITDLSGNEVKNDEENPLDSASPQDLMRNEITSVVEDNYQNEEVQESGTCKESEVEPFLVPPSENDGILYESSSNSLPSCFSLESIGSPNEQVTPIEPSSMNQSNEENIETSSLLENPQIVEHNHVISSKLESSAFKVFLLYLNKDTFETDTNSKNLLEPILKSVMDKNIPVIVLHEQDFAKGARPDFGYFIKHTPEHLIKPLYTDIATPIYSQEEYRVVSLCSIVKKIIEEHKKRRKV